MSMSAGNPPVHLDHCERRREGFGLEGGFPIKGCQAMTWRCSSHSSARCRRGRPAENSCGTRFEKHGTRKAHVLPTEQVLLLVLVILVAKRVRVPSLELRVAPRSRPWTPSGSLQLPFVSAGLRAGRHLAARRTLGRSRDRRKARVPPGDSRAAGAGRRRLRKTTCCRDGLQTRPHLEPANHGDTLLT